MNLGYPFLHFKESFSVFSFFLDIDSIGKPRAQVATQLLLELNPEVKGDYVDEAIEELLQNNPDFFKNFTVVVATSLPERYLILNPLLIVILLLKWKIIVIICRVIKCT